VLLHPVIAFLVCGERRSLSEGALIRIYDTQYSGAQYSGVGSTVNGTIASPDFSKAKTSFLGGGKAGEAE